MGEYRLKVWVGKYVRIKGVTLDGVDDAFGEGVRGDGDYSESRSHR